MKALKTISQLAVSLILVFCLNSIAIGQELRESLFKEADNAIAKALEARADILAPKSFGEAMKYYKEAEDDFKKGRKLDNIRNNLERTVQNLDKAVGATELAEVTFKETVQARTNAQKAGAPEFSTELWTRAEKKFVEAATLLERGDVNRAMNKGNEALKMYQDTELDSIQNNLLKEARTMIEKAEKENADDLAPKTLQSARDTVKLAEKELAQSRYDTDVARDLALKANHEAKHALYLTKRFKLVKDKYVTMEDLALDWEATLNQIATTAEITPRFHKGFHKTAAEIIEQMEKEQSHSQKLRQELNNRDQKIQALEWNMTQLEKKFGGAKADQMALKQHIETQAKLEDKFNEVETMFTRQEATVFRKGDKIYIRMVGLKFDTGKSDLDPKNFKLLAKFLTALDLFPGSRIVVEGHTDSVGSAKLNLKLSRERANNVRKYIIANTDISRDLTTSIGYGETRPIANNETKEGRQKNRRIDVVITPDLEKMI